MLKRFDLAPRELVGFGSDGCSTMLGQKSGVAVRLKEICPCLINFHCPAHRLQLAIMDVAGNVLTSNSRLIFCRIDLYKKSNNCSRMFTVSTKTLPNER